MAAAAGITTSAQPPTAVVNIQPGMNIQPVVLVDANGQYVTPGGSTTTAGSLATTTVPVNVAAATAPSSGQVLTATSGTTATWQAVPTNVLTTLGDTIAENSAPTAVRVAGNTTATTKFYTQTGTGSASALPVWGTIAAGNLAGLLTMYKQSAAAITPNATLNTLGSPVTISADSGFTGFTVQLMTFTTTGFGTETVTLQSVVTYSDNTTSTQSALTTFTSSQSNVSFGINAIVAMLGSIDGKYVKSIAFSVKSTINSSTASVTVTVVGLNLP